MTLRPTLIVLAMAGIAALAVGLAAGILVTPGAMPGGFADGLARPVITLPTIIVAGVVDGINPCAFTLLLLFITTLLAGSRNSGAEGTARSQRRMLINGGAFIAAIFLAYLVLGTGLMQISAVLAQNHLGARIGALLSILLGLWMLKDYFLPGVGPRLAAPAGIGKRVRAADISASTLAMFGLGALVSLCTVPCSGAVYIGIISLLALQESFVTSYAYLLLYNVMFILPLVVILLAAASRPSLNRMARWNLRYREKVKLFLGGGVVVLGLAILGTA